MLKKLIFVFGLAVVALASYDLKPEKISDTVYRFEGTLEEPNKKNGGNMVNTYWVKGKSSWIVIDSGPSYNYADAAYKQMKKIANLPVKYVFNTHRHEDHWLGNNYFKEKFGAHIYGTKTQAKEYPAGMTPNYAFVITPEDYKGTKVIDIDTFITKDMILELDGRSFQIKHFDYAVHSPEDLMAYMADEKVLLAGDILFSQRIPRITDGSVEGGLKSLDVVETYDVKIYATGHGKFTDKTAIGQMRAYFKALKETALKAIAQEQDVIQYQESADFSAFKNMHMMDELHKGNLAHAHKEYEFFEEK